MNNEIFYTGNEKYSSFLDNQNIEIFVKYTDIIKRFSAEGDRILDVGCGNGMFGLHLIKETTRLNFPFNTSKIPSLNYLAGDIDEETVENTRNLINAEIEKIPHGREILKADFQLMNLNGSLHI